MHPPDRPAGHNENESKSTNLVRAATVIIIADNQRSDRTHDSGLTDDAISVLMLQRNPDARFAGGMWVFPGGKVDSSDGADGSEAANRQCAVRETQEEAGISLDPKALTWFSHWTPPKGSGSRFLTTFYLAVLDQHATATIDASEIVDSAWISPKAALDRRERGDFNLSPPTWITLWDLAQGGSASDIVRRVQTRAAERYATFLTSSEKSDLLALYDGDFEYPSQDVDGQAPAPAGQRLDSGKRDEITRTVAARVVGPLHRLNMASQPWKYSRHPTTIPSRIAGSSIQLPTPDRLVQHSDGRVTAVDIVDLGAPDVGTPRNVVYFHGTPDTRLARPPADGAITTNGSVRMICADRAGLGDSDPDPSSTPSTIASDTVDILDALGIAKVSLFGWSAGALFALAMASAHPNRVERVVLAAPLAPTQSFESPNVFADLSPSRIAFAELVAEEGPEQASSLLAPYLVPHGLSQEVAESIILDEDDPLRVDEIKKSAGAARNLAQALAATTQQGFVGLERELVAQTMPMDLESIICPVEIVVGSDDRTCPPSMSKWYHERISVCTVTLLDGAGHFFPLARWMTLLEIASNISPKRASG